MKPKIDSTMVSNDCENSAAYWDIRLWLEVSYGKEADTSGRGMYIDHDAIAGQLGSFQHSWMQDEWFACFGVEFHLPHEY